jgi:histidyl-tRNA synthetase
MLAKGFRDFEPRIQSIRQKIFEKLAKIFESFGFEPLETPIIELWETLRGKYGEEAEKKLVWRFKLPYSEKEYALRYDLTVPLARFFAEKRPKLPFKRYQIGPVFRYDEPQKGRYREFYQADFDIVGSEYPESDAEILNIVDRIFSEFKIDYKIKINHRGIIEGIIKSLNLQDKLFEICRIIDKKDKIGIKKVKDELEKITYKANDIIEIITLPFEEVKEKLEKIEECKNSLKNIEEILEFVNSKNIEIDLSIVRGLDYYTGMVFEVIGGIKIGSLSGGGRYDNLIEKFVGMRVPAVGGSIGVERLIDTLLELKVLKEEKIIDIGIVYTELEVLKDAWKIANELREIANVYIDVCRKSFREQIEYLVKKNVRYLIIVGRNDLENNEVTFQDRETKERKRVKISDLKNFVKLNIKV